MDHLVNFLLNFNPPALYSIIFGILLLCGLGLPMPEDVVLFAGGLMSYYGLTDIWLMIAVALAGVILGDSIIYFLGHHYGRKLTKNKFFHKLLPDDRLAAVGKKFREKGVKLLFAARFMPGLRAPVFFSAGTLHVPYSKFLLYNGGAAFLSVPAIVGSVYYFGDHLDRVIVVIKQVQHSILFIILAVILLIVGKWYITHRKLKRG
jgi:membrane protein DedA with SNARE-associated domain